MEEVPVKNPRNGEVLYTLREYSDEEVAGIYGNARAAFETLRKMSVRQRLDELLKLRDYVIANKERIVARICEETGKSRTDAMLLEIYALLDLIDFYNKTAEKSLADQTVLTPIYMLGKKSKIYFEPMGPVLIISPWNYPFLLSFHPIICALVAGNPVILKPSSYTPLKGVYEDIVDKSGFVKNAIQVVYGSRVTGNKLIEAKPRKICFTGSVAAGKKVMAQASNHLIPVELELGGKDPMIVFDDVDINRTANGALWGGFVNAGQTCTSIERIFVQEGIYDRFVAALKDKASRLRTSKAAGTEADKGDIDVGIMTAPFQVDTVEQQIAEAREKGATIALGGTRDGHLIPPTIITNVDNSMTVHVEETFGPILTVAKFKTEEEAIRLANDSPYGLSASVWSADLDRADRVARALDTGNVSINNALATQGNGALPFGGVKDSGFGRYKGQLGLYSFCNIKSILVDKQSSKSEPHWYPYTQAKYKLFSKIIDVMFLGGIVNFAKAAWLGLKLDRLTQKTKL
ncbi:MAG: aldehyde dehydrogenase family protein [Candidatus Hydrogenedentales bacterium]|jgi:acyl-CoA reductase-like NAD-dependent aldehyde dehydrogenase